jgi:hypothetical protein
LTRKPSVSSGVFSCVGLVTDALWEDIDNDSKRFNNYREWMAPIL